MWIQWWWEWLQAYVGGGRMRKGEVVVCLKPKEGWMEESQSTECVNT